MTITGVCIFCGGGPTTRAHIFRKGWIDQLFPIAKRFGHRHVRREVEPFDKPWLRREADFKVKCACDACNSGWMDRLDHAAEDLFATAAAIGYPAKLSRSADKQTVARWCVLIGTLFDQAQAWARLPSSFHQTLYAGQVPDGVGVWLANAEPPQPGEPSALGSAKDWHAQPPSEVEVDGGEIAVDQSPGHDSGGCFVTFGVGRLLAQVFVALKTEAEEVVGRRVGNKAILRQLWPDVLTPLVWPQRQSVPQIRWKRSSGRSSTGRSRSVCLPCESKVALSYTEKG